MHPDDYRDSVAGLRKSDVLSFVSHFRSLRVLQLPSWYLDEEQGGDHSHLFANVINNCENLQSLSMRCNSNDFANVIIFCRPSLNWLSIVCESLYTRPPTAETGLFFFLSCPLLKLCIVQSLELHSSRLKLNNKLQTNG